MGKNVVRLFKKPFSEVYIDTMMPYHHQQPGAGGTGKRSLSYIVGGAGGSNGLPTPPWRKHQSGYDNPGFKRATSLTSSINLTADNLDFVIDSGMILLGMIFHVSSVRLHVLRIRK